ncbi:helix-turn-helix transcriptional regulator [Priestia megaterium]|uniref:Helix-turn-helix family protein n=1 Tax=Priestia megaterium (strain ATCC 14581 / DSM 32 / CCUG 1817 / JCM 2506 / NBRC 15308 / NCIMB 9376 / NCTC 10342 / NRRL B-14308 / VKM B-512 / Ford 19) TaxID=1348623 RepID=A0A0B6AGQ7_PRIM2|nr:helix-turn-helix transcriptional regulator [Priestia megaterium]AJI22721.1 helix-turn-helix family protein [Priestia megaterium NBRC 15308 = ATCC 14581]KGJ84202.1 DNA-binding protein [Priestia megaterium NBRC 15308 = ATCC 14581]MDR4230419.1 helix-turn-helix transcriptional regulator [Priestia megaterium]MED3805566.1 helix-turn-helix transcriptional regulator [Priestia megaterium]MED4396280.1 helix-turn-helix transcriptional regulator [Priestia megaterium]
MALGDRMRSLRESKELTQKQLADKLGIPNQNVSNYERGFRQPDYDTLQKIASFFEVSIDYLITGNEYRVSSDEMWKELLDPKTELFFKDLKSAPEEKIEELIRFWEFINERDK